MFYSPWESCIRPKRRVCRENHCIRVLNGADAGWFGVVSRMPAVSVVKWTAQAAPTVTFTLYVVHLEF